MPKNKWTVILTNTSIKDLRKISGPAEAKIQSFLCEKLPASDDPRSFGKKLSGSLQMFWSYRVGEYRILAKIKDTTLIVSVIHVGHRKDIYKKTIH